MKSGGNFIHGNEFYDFDRNTYPISMYTQYSGVSNNEICHNNFHDVYEAMIVGNDIDSNPSTHTLIHDNTFNNCERALCLPLNSGSGSSYTDIEIYYNQFISCGTALYSSSASSSVFVDTQIAYNTFTPSITNPGIEGFTNTMVYGNTGLADFNVPAVKPIPPP